jgi:hypothetical protein
MIAILFLVIFLTGCHGKQIEVRHWSMGKILSARAYEVEIERWKLIGRVMMPSWDTEEKMKITTETGTVIAEGNDVIVIGEEAIGREWDDGEVSIEWPAGRWRHTVEERK